MKTLTIFLFAAVFAFVGQSCFTTGIQDVYIIAIQNLETRNMIYQNNSIRPMELHNETNVVVMDSGMKYAFEMSFIDTVLSIVETSTTTIFQSTAYAIDESYDAAELNSNITDVSITTVYDFDSSHLETANVGQYFSLLDHNLYQFDTVVTYFNDRLNRSIYYPPIRFFPILVLNKRPNMSDSSAFLIKLEFEDGTEVQAITDPVVIK